MNSPTDFDIVENLSDALWNLWKVWHHRSQTVSEVRAVTPEQYWLLRELGHRRSATVTELASARGVTKSAITLATRKMQAQGWVRRIRLPENQRVVQIDLTEIGWSLWQTLRVGRRTVLAEMVRHLNDAERREFLRLTDKIRELSWNSESDPKLIE